MSKNGFDVRVENSSGGSLIRMEETGINLFLDAYQPGPIDSDNQAVLNDATNINKMIRWFNEQYSKLGGGLGNLYPDIQDDDSKLKRLSITDRK